MFQWIRLNVPDVGGVGSNPGQATSSHMLQPRPGAAIRAPGCCPKFGQSDRREVREGKACNPQGACTEHVWQPGPGLDSAAEALSTGFCPLRTEGPGPRAG